LAQAIDRIDDLWTGTFLGRVPLGLYSRAYAFATYPRRMLGDALSAVSAGTFAELKSDPARLAAAFSGIHGLVVRAGFLVAGLLAVPAPEMVAGLLGTRWLPMVEPFRVMLAFAVLAPLERSLAQFHAAVGRPGRVVAARALQLAALAAGLVALGPALGVAGVALAVSAAAAVAVALLLAGARSIVPVSVARLFGAPSLALAVALAAAWLAGAGLREAPEFGRAAARTSAFALAYLTVLLALERRRLPAAWRLLAQLRRPAAREAVPDGEVFP
jgi:O-antigen/teichoic acid export membrane protein